MVNEHNPANRVKQQRDWLPSAVTWGELQRCTKLVRMSFSQLHRPATACAAQSSMHPAEENGANTLLPGRIADGEPKERAFHWGRRTHPIGDRRQRACYHDTCHSQRPLQGHTLMHRSLVVCEKGTRLEKPGSAVQVKNFLAPDTP